MFSVTIYTDGACSGNPGVGGYGAIITCKGKEHIVKGSCPETTTNNRMEIMAIIEAVKALKKPCEITIHTDSQYVCTSTSHDKKWLTSESRPNRDLWIQLIEAGNKGGHKIRFVKVKGHDGIALNERCDKIAKEQCLKARHEAYGN